MEKMLPKSTVSVLRLSNNGGASALPLGAKDGKIN